MKPPGAPQLIATGGHNSGIDRVLVEKSMHGFFAAIKTVSLKVPVPMFGYQPIVMRPRIKWIVTQ